MDEFFVVQTGTNANGSYRIWNDGFIEQEGIKIISFSSGNRTNSGEVVFPVLFSDADWVMTHNWSNSDVYTASLSVSIRLKTEAQCTIHTYCNNSRSNFGFSWHSRGY